MLFDGKSEKLDSRLTSHPAVKNRGNDGQRAKNALIHFTPCISLLISGATANNTTPDPTSDQKPNV